MHGNDIRMMRNAVRAGLLSVTYRKRNTLRQEAQLSKTNRATLGVDENFAKSLKVVQCHSNVCTVLIVIHYMSKYVSITAVGRHYVSNYYAPARREGGNKRCFCPFICPSVCLSVRRVHSE